jgi:UPF0716 protein FxsA
LLVRLLLLSLLLVPIAEIAFAVFLVYQTSLLLVIGLLVAAGIAGSLLARWQGLRAAQRISAELQSGRMPAEGISDAVIISAAAVLLIVPGFLSDIAAILLLIPFTRGLFKRLVRRWFRLRMISQGPVYFGDRARDEIIDVEVVTRDQGAIGSRPKP